MRKNCFNVTKDAQHRNTIISAYQYQYEYKRDFIHKPIIDFIDRF